MRINLETYIRFPNKKRIIIRNLKLIQLPNLSLNGVSLAIGMILSLILISCGRSTVIHYRVYTLPSVYTTELSGC